MPSRRTVVLCLGTALVTGFGAGAIAGVSGGGSSRRAASPTLRGTATTRASATATATATSETREALSYVQAEFVIAPTLESPVAGHHVVVSVPQGWDEKIRESPLFRDYEEPRNGDWVRVRVFPAEGNAALRPREVALSNLRELRTRDEGLDGYQDLGQENLGVETSDTPVSTKPCYQLRYSFVSPTSNRRRWALERFFGDEDVVYLVAGYAWSPERLERLEPVLATVIKSLNKTEP